MIGIIYNEWLKSWYGRKTWLFSLVMLVFIAGAIALSLFTESAMQEPLDAATVAELSAYLFPVIVMIFGVVLIAGAIAGEFSNGTIKQLLIRPASRHSLLFGKWFGNLLLSILVLFITILLSTTLSVLIFNTETTSVTETFSLALEVTLYQIPTLVFYMALATLVAVLTKSTALTIVITFSPLFFSSVLQMFISQYEWAKWAVISHIEFLSNYYGTDLAIGNPPFENMWASLAFLLIHIIVILIVTHVVFKKRDVL
ncbi:hypothetical protein DH09_19695 [Bacillaceae bacterium JMAK1]|nr:hypothetical protein DH09_19695 [Bacillaceae bacterium JMAK1]